jgi:hypothetical protein
MRITSRAPLSGDVMQSINPFSWFIRSMGQLGLININLGRTPAPEIEERILDDVGSYGRQIGRISDALEVLIDRLDTKDLDEAQREAVILFKAQLAEVRKVKTLAYAASRRVAE